MKTVLVTGASGFIGKNLCAQLELDKELRVIKIGRDNTLDDIKKALPKIEFVFHLAGANRPTDQTEFETVNHDFTKKLLSLIKDSGKDIPVLITSSIQADLDNPYGKSKKAAEDAVFEWQKATSGQAFVYRLPNIFGKWCRPNYNSVVATFCHNIANNLDIQVNDPKVMLTLSYVDDVVRDFIESMRGNHKPAKDGYCHVSRTFQVSLGDLATTLQGFKESRDTLLVPNFEDPFTRFLYATYTSYFNKDDFGYDLLKRSDDRGWLAEFAKSKQTGAIFVSRTKPGISRGNHWHHTKIEKFLVLHGKADIKFRPLGSKEVITYSVTGDDARVLDIPAGYVHSITNTGDEDLVTLFWADEILDPDAPDTYPEVV